MTRAPGRLRGHARLPPLLLALLCATTTTHAAPPRFAYAMELMHDPGTPVQSLLLHGPVYEGLQRNDLGDLRVLSGDGSEVPHAIRSLGPKLDVERRPIPLPIFPLYSRRANGAGDSHLWAIEAETNERGAVVRVLQQTPSATPDAPSSDARADAGTITQRPTAILIDASALEHAISTLHVVIDVPPDSTEVSGVTVEQSDDLAQWTPLAHGALTRLQHAGHVVDRTDIDLPLGRYRYLKLEGADERLPTVTAVNTYAQSATDTRAPLHARVMGRTTDKPNRYAFDVPGPLPIDSVGIVLPESNTIVSATLFAVRADDKRLTPVWNGIAYRLADGTDSGSTAQPITLDRTRFTRFELEVDPKGGGIGTQMPELDLTWMPEQLLFVARGEGPYTLVFGSAQAQPSAFNPSEIPGLRDDLPDSTVLAGPKHTHDGDAALRPAPKPTTQLTPKTLALWATLLLAVILIAVLALRIVRNRD